MLKLIRGSEVGRNYNEGAVTVGAVFRDHELQARITPSLIIDLPYTPAYANRAITLHKCQFFTRQNI